MPYVSMLISTYILNRQQLHGLFGVGDKETEWEQLAGR